MPKAKQQGIKQKSKSKPKKTKQTKPKNPSKTNNKPFDWTLSQPPERDSAVVIRDRLGKIAALMNRGMDYNTAKRMVA